MKFGLIGKGLSHSYSKAFFEEYFARNEISATYDNLSLEAISEFEALAREFCGFNVTIPYKQAIIPFLDELDPVAERIGAVNCISNFNGVLKGYNTDYYGFAESLKPLLRADTKAALVLGSGGAARAVCVALEDLGVSWNIVSRSGREGLLRYSDLSEKIISDNPLIINATPCGMFPKTDESPQIPYEFLSDRNICYDLIYNPAETEFLRKSRERGATIKNGLQMLELQALKSMEIFNLKKLKDDEQFE